MKKHPPEQSSGEGWISQGTPLGTRQSFCGTESWQLKNSDAWLLTPELAQRRKGMKKHPPEQSSGEGWISQGTPLGTRQSFCGTESWQLKNSDAWLLTPELH